VRRDLHIDITHIGDEDQAGAGGGFAGLDRTAQDADRLAGVNAQRAAHGGVRVLVSGTGWSRNLLRVDSAGPGRLVAFDTAVICQIGLAGHCCTAIAALKMDIMS